MASYIKTTIFNDFTPFFSPVKFHDSSQEAGEDCSLPDLSGILASLNNTSVDGNALEREIGLSEENGAQNLATSVHTVINVSKAFHHSNKSVLNIESKVCP